MARGVRKPVEEKIREKQEIIHALKVRIQKEQEELEVLLKEEREKNMEMLKAEMSFVSDVPMIPFSAENGEGADTIRSILDEINEE